ncbi:MAG: peptide deformylase [Parachlamydiaceae bacterium]|nr:peptide deformylase [Parachlamydiaceae bacterium]
MKLRLAYYGDEILRKKTTPIDDIDSTILQLIEDMTETMQASNGCGLAAPQVHQSLSLFITKIPKYNDDDDEKVDSGELRVFINPKIISFSEELWPYEEGCLSIPGMRAVVDRPLKVTIEAIDQHGQIFTEEFEKFDAHVIMHENDHLNGVLYIDRLPPKKRKSIDQFLKSLKKKHKSA